LGFLKILKDCIGAFSDKTDYYRICWYFAGLALFFYIDKIFMGSFAFVRLHDVFDSDYSRYKILGELFYKNGFFSWYPHYLGGLPAYAWHHTPFYILCLVSLVVPLWFIYSFLCCMWMFLAGFGLFRLLNEYLGIPRKFSLVAGLFYSTIVQIQPNSIPQVVFNYAFPVFLVWFLDLFKNVSIRKKIIPLAGLNFLLLISYPVLTLPYYPVLHVAMILFVVDPDKLPAERKSLVIKSCIVWFGYILMNLPVLYSLWDYIPLAVKKVDQTVHIQTSFAGMLKDFVAQSFNGFSEVMSRTLMLIPFVSGIAFFSVSKNLRNLYILWFAVFFVTTFFTSKISLILKDSIFLKMDLSHFSWTLPFLSMLIASLSINMIIEKQKSSASYNIFLVTAFLVLCAIVFLLNLPVYLFIANIYILIIIMLFLRCVKYGKHLDHAINIVQTIAPKKFMLCLVISIFAQIAIILLFFKPRAYMLINMAVFVVPIVMMFVVVSGHIKHGIKMAKPAWIRTFYIATLVSLCMFLVLQIRIVRFNGMEPEKYSYKLLESYTVLDKIKKKETGIYRIGAVGGIPHVVLANHGFESIDGRGPISNRYFKDYFKLIVKPQLAEKKDELFFDSYWYNLFLTCGSGDQNFNYPLLSLANVKYLVSSDNSQKAKDLSDVVMKERKYLNNLFYDILNPPFVGSDNMLNINVYRLKETFERWYLASTPVIAVNRDQTLDLLLSQSSDTLRNNVIYAQPDIEKGYFDKYTPKNDPSGKIELLSYSPDRIVLNTTIAVPAIMVITNNYDKRWAAYINGVKTKIVRANHAFQSFLLDKAGSHKVDIRFEDRLLWMLHCVMIFGFILLNVTLLLNRSIMPSGSGK